MPPPSGAMARILLMVQSTGQYNVELDIEIPNSKLENIFVDLFIFSGNYGPNVSLEKLKDFHRRRLQVLVEAGPDLLAFETIPNKLEAQVYMLINYFKLMSCIPPCDELK